MRLDLGGPETTCLPSPACRVFHDRLINNEDKEYFKKMLVELMGKHSLGGGGYEELFVSRNIMFGDFLRMGMDREDRKYEEVADMPKLNQVRQVCGRYDLNPHSVTCCLLPHHSYWRITSMSTTSSTPTLSTWVSMVPP